MMFASVVISLLDSTHELVHGIVMQKEKHRATEHLPV